MQRAQDELLAEIAPNGGRFSRRALLKYGGLLGAAGAAGLASAKVLNPTSLPGPLGGPNIINAVVTRREDMLCLHFEIINMFLNDEPPTLIRGTGSAYIIVHFPPQAIAEQAFQEYTGDPKLPTPPVRSRVADPSRIAFFVPTSVTEIPFTIESLLDWSQLSLRVVPVAAVKRPFRGRPYREPLPEETSIEAPYRLVVSPPNNHKWSHPTEPITHNDRSDLWRTELVPPEPTKQNPAPRTQLRAVWTRGFKRTVRPPSGRDTFNSSLDNEDRWQIIRSSSDWTTFSTPTPIDSKLFSLSALGAWIDVEGNWTPKGSLDLEHWKHQAILGRDNFVKLVYQGYLFPFGHKAALTTITQRKLQWIETGAQNKRLAAFLRQRTFITVREPTKTYARNNMPFTRIQIHSLQTPDLNPPKDSSVLDNGKVFWPRVGSNDFRFLMSALDKDGKLIWFTAPLIYVPSSRLNKVNAISSEYASANLDRNRIPMNGQDVSLAPAVPGSPGETSMPTKYVEFGITPIYFGKPSWRPRLKYANLRLKALEEIKGKDFSRTVQYHQAYTDSGFGGKNQDAQIFLKLISPVALDFADGADADKAGGLATPNMQIAGLSRKVGPIAGKLANGQLPTEFDPKQFFKGAKILGGIELAEIIKVLDTVRKAPQMFSRAIHPDGNTLLPPIKIETEMKFHLQGTSELKSDPDKIFEPLPNAELDLNAKFITPLLGGIPEYRVVGELKNFKLNMIGKSSAFLILRFNRLKFASETGKAPDVDVDIEEVVFAGALKFVNELKDFMDFGGNGLNIDVTPQKIEAGYTLAIPTITTGIFTLANVSLAAGVTIPFTGKPLSARFSFCRPDAQFLLTYTIFGGGGFAQIAIGTNEKSGLGIELLEIGLEFGAAASINLGVASGGVQLMAGIYFKMATVEGCDVPSVKLSGYVRLGGELDVLGIINISIEFRMSLIYDSSDGSVWGQATLVVEVDVLFISKSVELTVEKKFGGGLGGSALCAPGAGAAMEILGPGPPPLSKVTFGDLMDADPPDDINEIWEQEYAAAFSTEAFA